MEDIYPVRTKNEIILIDNNARDDNLQTLHSAIYSEKINFSDVVKLLEKIKLSKKEVKNGSQVC